MPHLAAAGQFTSTFTFTVPVNPPFYPRFGTFSPPLQPAFHTPVTGPTTQALDRFVELIGAFWNENGFGVPGGNAGSVKSTKVVNKGGVVYYEYELTKPHNLISAAVTDGQLYVINASAGSERQWQQGEANLRNIVSSFYVPP